jgi:hypothetical protein
VIPPSGEGPAFRSQTVGRGRRGRVLANLLVGSVSLVLALVGLEVLLRARPTVLGEAFANGALSKFIATLFDAIRYPVRKDPPAALQSSQERIQRRSIAEGQGSSFVRVQGVADNRRQYDLVRGIARHYGLPFLDTSALTSADAALWLPGDGHLSRRARGRWPRSSPPT